MTNIFTKVTEPIEIMVVDDAPENIRLLARILKMQGFQISSAESGEAAIELLQTNKPKLILIDMRMPGIGGVDTCKIIKGNPKLKDLPIIFISGMDDYDSKTKAIEAGGIDYICKPFLVEDVLLRVNNALKTFSS